MSEGLPRGWATATLGELCVITSGQTPQGVHEQLTQDPGDIPWFCVGDMNKPQNSPVMTSPQGWLSATAAASLGIHTRPKGTILFPKRGGAIKTNKKRLLGVPGAYDLNVMGLIPARDLGPYVWAWMQSVDLGKLGDGSTVPQINNGDVAPLSIPIAPLNEQRRIVAKLDALQARSRRARQALDAIPALLDRFRQSVLAAAFRGDLTAEWRAAHPDVEPASVLLQRIRAERKARWVAAEVDKARAKAQAKEGGTWGPKEEAKARVKAEERYEEPEAVDTEGLPELPKGWCWATVDELAHVGTGATPKRGEPKYWDSATIPWVTSGAVNNEYITEPTEFVTSTALRETNLSLYPPGTLLVAMYGEGKTRGSCSELSIEATTNQALAALVFDVTSSKCRSILKAYLNYQYEATRMASSGGVQPNLNLSIIRAIQIPLPPLDEQLVIESYVKNANRARNHQIEASQTALNQLDTLDQAILAKAFRGELVPQDPNDEPASALLQRITAERDNTSPKTATRGRKAKGKP